MNSAGTVALVIKFEKERPILLDVFSDDIEISVLESAFKEGSEDPLQTVYQARLRQEKEEEAFGDYVEELLSNPCVRVEIADHGVQWLKSKIKIEDYKKCETDASQVIADYAFKIFENEPERREFMLAGPSAEVRVRVFVVDDSGIMNPPMAA